MFTIRRAGAAMLALALALPLTTAPVAGHGTQGFLIDYDVRPVSDGYEINGRITNHAGHRQTGISISATFSDATGPIHVETGGAFITNLAPHASSPFAIAVEESDVKGFTSVSVTASGSPTTVRPAGGLHVTPGDLAGNTYSGSVMNDASVLAEEIVVYGIRLDGSVISDAAASTLIETLEPGVSAPFTIAFDPASDGEEVAWLIAETTGGTFLSSWNNYFSDLGQSPFPAEIAWMADAGVTTGCAPGRYCPKGELTREEMAVFLVRVLDLPPAFEDYFTDDESSFAEAEINALRQEGLTTGCTATTFCPKELVTREQMAAFLDRAYELPRSTTDFFTDDESSFAEAEINDLAGSGITSGCTATTFCPRAIVTREQLAAFLYRSELAP